MTALARNTYSPDYCVHPGEILQERLEVMGMRESEFADRCQISVKTVSQIINGKAPVTPQHAIHFERVLGDAGVAVVGGFHSSMERDCLDLLLRGNQPIVICLGRSIEGARLPTA